MIYDQAFQNQIKNISRWRIIYDHISTKLFIIKYYKKNYVENWGIFLEYFFSLQKHPFLAVGYSKKIFEKWFVSFWL